MSQFLIEYILRIWSAGARGRYDGIRGRLRYATSFFPLLDLLVVVAGITLFIFGWADSRLDIKQNKIMKIRLHGVAIQLSDLKLEQLRIGILTPIKGRE